MKAGKKDTPVTKRTSERLEEALHLLRRVPAGVFALYYAGAGLWILGLLFFWARVTWFAPSALNLASGAVGLVLLYVVLKVSQTEFSGRLMDICCERPLPAFSLRRLLSSAEPQAILQSFGPFGLTLSALVSVPFGWVFAYFQCVTVIGRDESVKALRTKAWEMAKLYPGENHLVLGILSLLACVGLVNIAAFCAFLPWVAEHFFGATNLFGMTGTALLNTTFFASVVSLVWLVLDPLVKAYYVLRVYYGQSRNTGDDILIELNRMKASRKAPLIAVVAMLLFSASTLSGADISPKASTDPKVLDQSITSVLKRSEFQWGLRPMKGPAATTQAESVNPLVAWIGAIVRGIAHAVERFVRWLNLHLNPSPQDSAMASAGAQSLKILLYLLIACIVVLILFVAYVIFKQARRSGRDVEASSLPEIAPDLADENVQAAQLPSSGWLDLARSKVLAGEWRLALRALYLATLADLGSKGLVTLARFKTNQDYKTEVMRRAAARPNVTVDTVPQFVRRVRTFEDVWYGQTIADETLARQWLAEMEVPAP